jgi:hypothetical protein
MTLAQTAALLDAMPSAGAVKVAAGVLLVLLAAACLWHLHVPRRSGGRFTS